MINIIDKEKCCGCSACAQICPRGSITMIKDEEGFFYPSVDKKTCIDCNQCRAICPFENNTIKAEFHPVILGAKAYDDEIRYWSSSGGIFTLVAESILEKNGIVFGVEMNEDCTFVKHVAVDHKENLKKLRGSKYIQSRIDGAYINARNYLEQGKPVLFTGTPCQISGLKRFLKKDYSQLFCVEVICHGVPSEELWNKYLNHIEQKYKRKVKNVSFRSKRYSWMQFGSDIQFNPKKTVFKFSFEDSFFRMFNSSYSMRPSCYECMAKGKRTMADMTIGDFWGVETVFPNFNDNKGVSIILMNNEKGKLLFELIRNKVLLSEKTIDYETAVKCNPPIDESIKKSDMRLEFFHDLIDLPFRKLEKKYTPTGPRRKLRSISMRLNNRPDVRGGGNTEF